MATVVATAVPNLILLLALELKMAAAKKQQQREGARRARLLAAPGCFHFDRHCVTS
jgi:hypothetical protein